MSILFLSSILFSVLIATVLADCRHPNGLLQTDPYHAPCSDVLKNPLNTMCCAIDRPNPNGGYSTNGYNADVCLPNGLCQQSWKTSEDSKVTVEYYREECTVKDWTNGKCLSVCLSNSVSSNVFMTPCDDTANSTKWCCGKNRDCCSGDVGVVTLEQTFLGMAATSATLLSSSVTASASISTTFSEISSTGTSSPVKSLGSASLPGGVIAGIVVGALAGISLIGVAWFFVARRRLSTASTPLAHVEGIYQVDAPKICYAHEADGIESQISEISAANNKDHDGKIRVHEMQ
ncbi:uncharacterized protein EKO05_0005037 [Ascochyta rabiei]|uniref:uncharacterized protein n=1 Tax=Didymella rabiei TaxID=5454 RepID=UPI00220EF6F8|nr:uncharacterized protein EKO05_0005037 [Ascochyta rabiei]UPX14559.1 hypothetical protein EKO05_0005037 [Ascochyta rabiei]